MPKQVRWQAPVALGLVYLIWGSTYLAVRYVVESVPAFTLVASRNLLSGAALLAIALWRRSEPIRWGHLKAAFMTGTLLIAFGNGSVALAQEHHVASGTAALVVGAIPLWIGIFSLLERGGRKAAPQQWVLKVLGLGLGFTGLVVLLSTARGTGESGWSQAGVMIFLVVGTLTWAWGSVNGRRWTPHRDSLLATGLAMVAGSVVSFVVGASLGESARFSVSKVDGAVVSAFLYLVVFGSIVGFTCYAWLLENCDHALVGTYAYVNPVIALTLGHWLAGESLSASTLMAGALVLVSIALITLSPRLVQGGLVRSARASRSRRSPGTTL